MRAVIGCMASCLVRNVRADPAGRPYTGVNFVLHRAVHRLPPGYLSFWHNSLYEKK